LKKTVLVCGVSGLTGYKIAKLASNFNIIGLYNTRIPDLDCETIQINLTDTDSLAKIVFSTKPDIIINTTALHNVDYCEDNQNESFAVNVEAVKNLQLNSEKIGAKLIHLSTDYVFDGTADRPYSETETPNPISIYGKTKLQGENILKNSNNVIVRPSVVYGWTPMELAGKISSSGKPINFAMWLLNSLHQKKPLKIVTDQHATATLADSLAESVLHIATTDKSGLYHISGLSCESRFDFSQKLAKEFGYDSELISPTTSSEFKQKAKRPAYSCLDCTKTIKDFDLKLLKTEDALKIMRSQVEKDAPNLLGK